MFDFDSDNVFGVIVICIVIIVAVVFLMLNSWKSDNEKCRAKGGVPIRTDYSFVCLKGIEEIK